MASDSSVLLVVHAPAVPIVSERRLPSDVALSNVRGRLELLCGIPPKSQKLSLWSSRTDDKDSHARIIARLSEVQDDAGTLLQLGAKDGMGLLVEDDRDASERDQFGTEEEEKVSKYEMDDEAYAQRKDTVLAFKQRNKMGRFGEGSSTSTSDTMETSSELPSDFQVGARCEVEGGRRGTIRFAGPTDFAKGVWVGVEYDEPVGKNDGSVAGKRYFTCKSKFGGFVKPEKVRVGDFPIRSLEEEDDDEEM